MAKVNCYLKLWIQNNTEYNIAIASLKNYLKFYMGKISHIWKLIEAKGDRLGAKLTQIQLGELSLAMT